MKTEKQPSRHRNIKTRRSPGHKTPFHWLAATATIVAVLAVYLGCTEAPPSRTSKAKPTAPKAPKAPKTPDATPVSDVAATPAVEVEPSADSDEPFVSVDEPAAAEVEPTPPAAAPAVDDFTGEKPPTISEDIADDGEAEYEIIAASYEARISSSGMLQSIRVGETELLGGKLDFPVDGQTSVVEATVLTEPSPGLQLSLLSKKGPAQVTYLFDARRIRAVISHSLPQWQSFAVQFSEENALAFEDLQERGSLTKGETIAYRLNGPRRAGPVDRLSRMQMLRVHYPDFNVLFKHDGWGAPYNVDEIGSLNGYRYHKNLLQENNPMTLSWVIEPVEGPARSAGPVYRPISGKYNNLYYVDEPITWKMELNKDTKSRIPANAGTVQVSWKITDAWDKNAGSGSKDFPKSALNAPLEVTLEAKGRGYFAVTFTISVPGTSLVPSDFYTRFSVIGKSPGLPELPAADANLPREYGDAALVGMKMIRMSHEMKQYFPDANTKKWNELDEIFNTSSAETKKWGITWMFQANSRPGWAEPAQYEEIAYELVSRYKDRCKNWEVENEPNFSYSPADYITKCLVPFAKGAKRADPNCVVMGPDCVSAPLNLQFLEEIYKQGAGKYLDAVSTHTYMGPGESWEQFGNLQYLARMRELMTANGDAKKPLWQTEQGYSWGSEPKMRQARYIARQYLCGYLSGIPNERQFYFYTKHNGFEPWYIVESGSSAGMNGTWNPGASSLRAMAEALDGTKFVSREPSPHDGIYIARFSGPDREVFAMWTLDFPIVCSLDVRGARELRDIMGNTQPVGNRFKTTLSGEPHYLIASKGAPFTFAAPAFGRNLSSTLQGSVYTASSSASGVVPANAGDGRWSMRDGAPNMTGQRTVWMPRTRPSPEAPAWLEIKLPVARPIDRILIICCLPAVECNPRDYEIQAWADGRWKTVASATDSTPWPIYHEFEPVISDRVRLVIADINDGWHQGSEWIHMVRESFTRYTDNLPRICDVQIFGPPSAVNAQLSIAPETISAPGKIELTAVLSSNARKRTSGSVEVSLPEGWKAEPASKQVALGGTGSMTAEFLVSTPRRMNAGTVPIAIKVLDGAGNLVEATAAQLLVESPIRLEPQSIGALDPAAQRLAIKVVSALNKRASGKVSIHASAEGLERRDEKPFDIGAGESATIEFVLKDFDIAGRATSIAYTANCDSGIDVETSQTVSIVPFSFIGPFSNEGNKGHVAVYPPERELDLTKSYDTVDGNTSWRMGAPNANGYFDFTGRFKKGDGVCAYAVCYVTSDKKQKAHLSLGSDDGIKTWLNGKLVVDHDVYRGASPGQEDVAVELRKGTNAILLKITQGGGGWGFYMSVLDDAGAPLKGLRYSHAPQE